MPRSSAFLPLPPHSSPNISCYLCRSCISIVGWGHKVMFEDILAVMPDSFLLSDIESANVIVEGFMPFVRGLHSVYALICSTCSNVIGWKIGRASGPLSTIFSQGRYILFGSSILFWNSGDLEDPVWRPSNTR